MPQSVRELCSLLLGPSMLHKRQTETHCRCQRGALPESRVRSTTLACIPGLSDLNTRLTIEFVTRNFMKSISLSI